MATAPTAEGLAMLGRSYVNLERVDDAVNAYHRAWEMTEGKAPEVSLGYAEALLLADRNTILTSAGDLLDQVLEQLPDNPKALWYGGMSSVARGKPEQAQQRLAHLLNQPNIPDQLRNVVQQQLAAMGVDTPDAGEAADASTAAAGAQISATIEMAPELQNNLQKSAVLFVFARETGQPGPPAAVKRIPAPSFPLTVTLTDADSMMGDKTLSRVKNLTLVARLSNSGNATATSGDLYGETQPDWPGDSAQIRIESTVP
jgi:cytochrome c-type biogenesis protein CcmH